MALDWIVGWWTEADVAEPYGLDWVDVNVGQQSVLQLVSDADLADHGDDCIVERVVGQYMFYADNAADTYMWHVHMRLCVRPEDPGAGGIWNAPINTFVMGDEKFMWHKVHTIEVNDGSSVPGQGTSRSNFGGQSAHPEWSHLDVRVNRRLQELDRLCLIFEFPDTSGPLVTGTLHYGAWLRVLVKSR